MKILIIGASGFTGLYLYKIFSAHNVFGTSRKDKNHIILDITDYKKVKEVINSINPEVICIPAYITNLDYCESHPEECRKTNVDGIKNIIKNTNRNIKIVFFSTDAVFKGDNGPYSEDDEIYPLNEYAKQKYEAEEIVKKNENYLIIRTCSIYGWDPRHMNFVERLINTIKEGKEFKAPVDQFYTPTYVKDLAEVTKRLVEKNAIGTFHVAGDEFLSRYEIGKKVCEIFNLKKEKLIPVKTKDLEQLAKRAYKGGLKNQKVKEIISYNFHTLQEGLTDMKKKQLILYN